uniref:Uncharacterized protein n=1 Tax=Anopheles minimus TaxID=112268 RepID=A0A182WNN9_9DIPT
MKGWEGEGEVITKISHIHASGRIGLKYFIASLRGVSLVELLVAHSKLYLVRMFGKRHSVFLVAIA